MNVPRKDYELYFENFILLNRGVKTSLKISDFIFYFFGYLIAAFKFLYI